MSDIPLYAHTPSEGTERWHPLDRHLLDVAAQARAFAERFGEGETARLATDLAETAGLYHDLGKAKEAFRRYLADEHAGRPSTRTTHAIEGATLLYQMLTYGGASQVIWAPVVLPVAGHHAGLKNPALLAQELPAPLSDADSAAIRTLAASLPAPPLGTDLSALPPDRRELLIRMALSALVDADHLDTEAHFDEDKADQRGGFAPVETLADVLRADQADLMAEAEPTEVNRVRREVYEACLASASEPPGFFRLTVPTGGGKTRSGLAFALEHARAHKLDRVVVAIPYTSIIDQTAAEYEMIFDPKRHPELRSGEVVVHHSALEEPDEERQDERAARRRLAAQNWDATLIVTTTVQLFESLLADRPGRVRKVHRLARSVIVLDEAQMLPPELLTTTLRVLRALVEDYGASVVFCTATQPAFDAVPGMDRLGAREIVPQPERHFATLPRVVYEPVRTEPTPWVDLAAEVRSLDDGQALVVLNSRRDALSLLGALGDDPAALHLSTLLCGAHRRQVIVDVKRRLDPKESEPIRLISTQVVEAGVDLDFPDVYRAIGPLDRIVQAAGRCNRNGTRPRKGRVVVFETPEDRGPRGTYRIGLRIARGFLDGRDLNDPAVFRDYFAALYGEAKLDTYGVEEKRARLDYPETAREYRFIRSDTVSVVVDWGDGLGRLAAWEAWPNRAKWRALQPYVVSVYRHQLRQYEPSVHFRTVDEEQGLYEWRGRYDDVTGLPLDLDDPADYAHDPAGLIA